MVDVFDTLFCGICYTDHSSANKKIEDNFFENIIRENTGKYLTDEDIRKLSSSLAEQIQIKQGESFYRSIIHTCLWMAEATTTPEKQENFGRLDLEVAYGGHTFILELKMTDNIITGPKASREGMDQMHHSGYGLSSENSILVSIAIGRKERNIVACICEKDHKQISIITKAHLRYLDFLKREQKLQKPNDINN
ncbi:MAG: PD-(D/E)XK nuclease domain-containing protein [Deltaproteobacteria bacterium]|nr:PD-(D/E)XK nuclease domain-containing protein [Deltaproteobacteria bacterium]